MDGAAFSRATTAGESSDNNESNTDAGTNTSKYLEDTYVTSDEEVLGLSTRDDSASTGAADKVDGGGVVEASEVRAQNARRNGFDESDYINLSQLLCHSPPSIPLVKNERLLSISHSGTLGKRRHSSTTDSPKGNSKRVKLEEISASELENVISLFERSRKSSQWDIKPPSFVQSDRHYLDALNGSPALPPTKPTVTNDSPVEVTPIPFDPPKGPRSMELPPVCFSHYQKDQCRPKNGRRCDHPHAINTTQQAVSLPHGTETHCLSYPLSQCPIPLRRTGEVKPEQKSFVSNAQPETGFVSSTPRRVDRSPFFEAFGSPRCDDITSTQNKPPGRMTSRSLPQLTGSTKARFEEQKSHTEQMGVKVGMELEKVASALEATHQRQEGKLSRHQKRKAAKLKWISNNAGRNSQLQTEERAPTKHAHADISDVLIVQKSPLPLSPTGEASFSAATTLPGNQNRKKQRNRNKNKPLNQLSESLRIGELVKYEHALDSTQEALPQSNASSLLGYSSFSRALGQPLINKQTQVDEGRIPGKWTPMPTNPQQVRNVRIVWHEYSHEDLGLRSEERRAKLGAEQRARSEWTQRQGIEQEEKGFAQSERARLPASATLTGPPHQYDAGNDGPVRRSRYRRCWEKEQSCGLTEGGRTCLHYKDAEIGAQERVARRTDDGPIECRQKMLVDYELPGSDQRLDWDTDLVRRLFGEIE